MSRFIKKFWIFFLIVVFSQAGGWASVRAAGSLTFLTSAQDNSDSSTYTFSSVSLGTADSDRTIIVGGAFRGLGTIGVPSSVTIAGETATVVVSVANNSSHTSRTFFAYADVPTGSSGDIVVVLPSGGLRMGIGVWSAIGADSAPYDIATSISDNPNVSIDIPDDGFAIGTVFTVEDTAASWTGIAEDYDAVSESIYSGASDLFATAESSYSISAAFGTANISAGSFVSWAFVEGEDPPDPDPGPEPSASSTAVYTYNDWIFVESVKIFLLSFIPLGFVLSVFKRIT